MYWNTRLQVKNHDDLGYFFERLMVTLVILYILYTSGGYIGCIIHVCWLYRLPAGYIVCWLYRLLVTSSAGYIVCWLHRLLVISSAGYVVCWLHRLLVTSSAGYIED